MFNNRNIPLSIDYRGRCGNCHELFGNDEEKYCKYCGTKRGEGEFKPYDNQIYCIYGPMPEKRTRECVKCGNKWTYISMLDTEKYCVQCGGQSKLVYVQEEMPLIVEDEPVTDQDGFMIW